MIAAGRAGIAVYVGRYRRVCVVVGRPCCDEVLLFACSDKIISLGISDSSAKSSQISDLPLISNSRKHLGEINVG